LEFSLDRILSRQARNQPVTPLLTRDIIVAQIRRTGDDDPRLRRHGPHEVSLQFKGGIDGRLKVPRSAKCLPIGDITRWARTRKGRPLRRPDAVHWDYNGAAFYSCRRVVAKSLYGGLRADYSAGGLVLKAHLIASTASAIGRASTKNVPIATETTMRLNEGFSSASNG
jgi:hypothetical protein